MNKALTEITKWVASDMEQENILFKKMEGYEDLPDKEAKWDLNIDGIKAMFYEFKGESKMEQRLLDPKKSKMEIAKSYLMNDNYKRMKKNKISRKEKITNDIANYFFVYCYENSMDNFNEENQIILWDNFFNTLNMYLDKMKIKYNIK